MSLRKLLLTLLVAVVTWQLVAPAGPAGAVRPEPTAQPASSARLGIPRTYDAAVHHIKKAEGLLNLRRFVSPSGNIYCALAVPGMPPACELNAGSIKDPGACGDNPVSKYVGRIEFHRGRAVPVCNTDTIRTPGAKVLGYGSADHVPGTNIECIMETIGVTCINLKRTEGFFLHRGEYAIFNAG
jgi:hypothetical protein